MTTLSKRETADRAGVGLDYLERLLELGLVEPDDKGGLLEGSVLKIQLVEALEEAGIDVDAMAGLIRAGGISLDWVVAAGTQIFAPMSATTFAACSQESGVPFELLATIREVVGGRPARPEDRLREDELAVVPVVQLQLAEGYRPIAIERTLRVYGDSMRRIVETESEAFRTEIIEAMLASGLTENDIGDRAGELAPRMSAASNEAVLALYHAQSRHAWMTNVIGGIAGALAKAGLQQIPERLPAMCFLDLTGYTRLTQERGDEAAADLAARLGRLVERASARHGGRPVKWLGDGAMSYFRDPGSGVDAALEMVDAVTDAGLPPAHVGVHAGPILFQEGDYFGQTVNIASRIAEYARPGEVLVSQEVVDASAGSSAIFREIGPVELKGVAGVMRLHAAHRAAAS